MSDRPQKPGKGGRKVRVDLKRNRSNVARDKRTWTRGTHEDADKLHDAATGESVRAKGDLSRKRTIIVNDETGAAAGESDGLTSGVVIAVRGVLAEVECGGQRQFCSVRRVLRSRMIGERQVLAVGDVVRVRPAGDGSREGVIEHVAPRKTTLVRQYESRVQIIAANVDLAVIVASADDPPLPPHLIDRFLVAAHKGDLKPIICINKMDLDDTGFAAEVLSLYAGLGYQAIAASVTEGLGVAELREHMRGQTSVVVGMSGVGKTSLLNAVEPQLGLRVGQVSETTGRGRHTTTTAELVRLAMGGYVVDTPGIRQFDLAHVAAAELEAYFIEFVGLVARCRFPDCTHLQEQGCAIIAAVEAGTIQPERYDSYAKMMTERMEAERGRHGR